MPICALLCYNRNIMNGKMPINQAAVEDFCKRWKVQELALFGSVLRENFGAESDIDILITFQADAHPTLFDFVRMQDELEQMLGRKVDLVERAAVEKSDNPIRRRHILSHVEPIYVAR